MKRLFVGLVVLGCLCAFVVFGPVKNRQATPPAGPTLNNRQKPEDRDLNKGRCPFCGGPLGKCVQGPGMDGCSGNGFKPAVQGVGPGTYQPKPWELDYCRPGYKPTPEDEKRNEDLRRKYGVGRGSK
jgi:hypothetical protein